ncbi:MAG TPA: hypothetical protein VN843_34750 [Anaerolineales bacterium]|nr:hypothetical protein [Anaerolineales bacterium]
MSNINILRNEESVVQVVQSLKDFRQAANDLCGKALNDAKGQLHPLLRNVEVDSLDRRYEFVLAFKLALERRIAQKLAAWQPGVQAVFTFDKTWMKHPKSWDSSIHLLVKVPRLSEALKTLGRKLDRSLVKHLKQLGWSRFRTCRSILDVQQVTPNELRHGISYGAMFCAVYNIPVKVWPQNGRRHEGSRR